MSESSYYLVIVFRINIEAKYPRSCSAS